MCHFLIFVQSWNDLGIGLIVSSLYSIVVVSELAGSAHCGVFFVFYVIFLTTAGFSVTILSAMNLERYASIVHPVYHRNKVTKKKLLIYIFSICALFLCVCLASFQLGQDILNRFSGYVFLAHFVSTVYLYTKIFLVGKAQLKRSQPRVNAPPVNGQIRENNLPMQQGNHHGNQSNYQGCSSDNQGEQLENKGERLNNQGEQSDNQREQSDNQGEQSDNQGIQAGNRGKQSENKGEQSVNQGERSENKGEQSNNQGEQSDNQGEQSDNRGKQSNNQGEQSDSQGEQSDNPERKSNNQGLLSGNQRNRTDNQRRLSDNNGRPYNQRNNPAANRQNNVNDNSQPSKQTLANRKFEQEFLMKFKLAKSCLIVVICSFIAFLLPTVFQPLKIDNFHEIILDGWFTILVLINSTLDSLIFFWKNKMLRNEAKKVLKNILS